mmetsp:Transcript_144280/g.461140  ORF Transcript_144280/g.461140 Transcript_144280/m.461140 type:complete len:245 (-) Transcript_144280:660-1394(-)
MTPCEEAPVKPREGSAPDDHASSPNSCFIRRNSSSTESAAKPPVEGFAAAPGREAAGAAASADSFGAPGSPSSMQRWKSENCCSQLWMIPSKCISFFGEGAGNAGNPTSASLVLPGACRGPGEAGGSAQDAVWATEPDQLGASSRASPWLLTVLPRGLLAVLAREQLRTSEDSRDEASVASKAAGGASPSARAQASAGRRAPSASDDIGRAPDDRELTAPPPSKLEGLDTGHPGNSVSERMPCV